MFNREFGKIQERAILDDDYICELCGLRFDDEQPLQFHKEEQHSGEEN